ncbi:unnamed protein product [Prorocentrum cordatum]|uniref:Ubiquitin-like domain-containing protein n=1 Tax=Prorocentrum cordatum TaxID=2364126 RepID=A0ABN9SBG0_9DINO|nr:unnamed protein product [Polarella glacialis]
MGSSCPPRARPHGAENMRTGGGRGAEQLTSSDIWHLGTRASMLVSVVACSGRELAAVEADPSWRLGDLLAAVPEQEKAAGHKLRILFGGAELCGDATLGEIGVQGGSELTLVVIRRRRIVTCAWAVAKVWDADSGECLRTLEGHRFLPVRSAVISADGQRVLTASEDRTAKIWAADSGQCLRTLEGHWRHVCSAVFSADGQRVLTASWDMTAKIWAADSGECLRTLAGHEGPVCSAVFSADGQRVLTASWETAKIWAVDSGECLRTLAGHRRDVTSAVFSADGQRVLTASEDRTAKIWAADSGACLRTLEGHRFDVCSAVFSADGQRVLTASRDMTAKIWAADSGAGC